MQLTPQKKDRLKICLLSYRSNPHCGGQGVYVRNLSRALKELGHQVEVMSGPPYPFLDDGIKLTVLPSLDLYNNKNNRKHSIKDLSDPINVLDWFGYLSLGFPDPFTFGLRAYRILKKQFHQYDIVHDNQSLSYAVLAMSKIVPTIATIHHPITVDRDIAINSVSSIWKKMQYARWYSFIGMQKRVARKLSHLITVSENALRDINQEFQIPTTKFRLVPNGIDTDVFYPILEIKRENGRIIVTNSADTPLKGLFHLLRAVAQLSETRKIKLIVIGAPKENGGVIRLIRELGIEKYVTFTGRISNEDFVKQYARASVAVVPSIYEGFGLPAGEAMACGVPVISTTGGALPEVVGDTGILVQPGDHDALANAIRKFLDNPEHARELGWAGYKRVRQNFTWRKAAEMTVASYRDTIYRFSSVINNQKETCSLHRYKGENCQTSGCGVRWNYSDYFLKKANFRWLQAAQILISLGMDSLLEKNKD